MATGARAFLIALAIPCCQVHTSSAAESAHTSSEDLSEPSAEPGECLLQTKSSRASKSQASVELPESLVTLGIKTFGSKEELDKVVRESKLANIEYAGISLVLRFLKEDNAAWRLGQKSEDGYGGLNDLEDIHSSKKDMVNMIDLGGNNGLVTIAVYNKYKGKVRAVVTEPISTTYFFMRWNMELNKVPYLTKDEFLKDTKKPGVVALHAGVTAKLGQDLHMCAHPEWSMNAIAQEQGGKGSWNFEHRGDGNCDCGPGFACTVVPGINTATIFDSFFQKATVTLMKMDCEGCEYYALPALMERPDRLKRLVGELHMPEEEFIDMSCKYDAGTFLTKVCRTGEAEWGSSLPLECGKERKVCKW